MKCPGQDTRYWRPGDIYEVPCPVCGATIEFYKDEPTRLCPSCKERIKNPRIDLGCLEWCEFAEKCLAGEQVEGADPWKDVREGGAHGDDTGD